MTPTKPPDCRQIEAILFWKAEPVSVKKLAQLLDTDVKNGQRRLLALESAAWQGVTLVQTEDDVMLALKGALAVNREADQDEIDQRPRQGRLETLSIVFIRTHCQS